MDKFLARLRSIKFQLPKNVRMPKLPVPANVKRPKLSLRQMIIWGVAFVLAIGLFISVSKLTTCWQLTPLPGARPANCAGAPSASTVANPTIVNAQGTPIAAPPTADAPLPDVQYPQWDGGSPINMVFFGLRGGDTSGEDCPQVHRHDHRLHGRSHQEDSRDDLHPARYVCEHPRLSAQPHQYRLDQRRRGQAARWWAGPGNEDRQPVPRRARSSIMSRSILIHLCRSST